MAAVINNLKKKIKNHPIYWRKVRNKKATSSFNPNDYQLTDEAKKALSEIKINGIAFTNAKDIIGEDLLAQLIEEAIIVKNNYETDKKSKTGDDKDFARFLLGVNPKFDKNSLFNKIANHPILQSFADNYFSMKDVEMRYYNVWHHLATQEEPSASQLWHRDREDLQILKVFIYLTDVSVENGPFTYAPQTHLLGKIQSEPEFFLEKNVKRTNDEMMNKLVNKNQWIQATAPKYTLIFADTHGFHKGGYVKEGERLLFTAMYVSPGCERHYFDK